MNRASRRFLFAIDLLEMGGIQQRFLHVCRALVERGDTCTALAFRPERDAMSEAYRQAGARVVFLEKQGRIDRRFLSSLKQCLNDHRFDLIQAMSPQAAFWIAMALPPAHDAVLLGSLSDVFQFESAANRAAERLVASRRVDGVVVNARAVGRYYQAQSGDRAPVFCIHGGVSAGLPSGPEIRGALRAEWNADDREFLIATAGRLVPVKRQADLLDATALLVREGLPVRCVIAGDGPLRSDLETRASRLGIRERTLLLGSRGDSASVMSACDAFVLPSRSEGFPNALLEAMAAGLPCVATNVGGVSEAIRDGQSGVLFAAGDVAGLAARLRRLVKHPGVARALGEEAARVVRERFSLDRMVRRFLALYDRLLAERTCDILYVLSQFPKISETFVLREIQEMRRRGLAIGVLSLKPPGEAVAHPEARALDRFVWTPPWMSAGVAAANASMALARPAAYLRTLWRFARLHAESPRELAKALAVWPKIVWAADKARRLRVRHVHAHWATIPTAAARAVAELLGRDYSFTPHAYDLYGFPLALEPKIRGARFITTDIQRNIDFMRSLASESEGGKMRLVRSILEFDESQGADKTKAEGPPVIVSVGSLQRYKGHDILLRAAAVLAAENVRFRLRVIGGGPEERGLRALARRVGVADRVEFTGPLPQREVFAALRGATVFALASRRNPKGGEDNLPTVLMEAAGCGAPIVVSDLGAVREFIDNGATGLLVPAGDAQALAAALGRLLADGALRERLACAARERLRAMFDIDTNASVLESLFREAVGATH